MSNRVSYIIHLADDALIMSQRLIEWTGHGPVLEQDIALTNIALDFLGQARNFYQYTASLMDDGATEDSLAMMRLEHEYKNHLLVELPNGSDGHRDWGQTVLKVFFFSAYQKHLMHQLVHGTDEQLRGIAEKCLKEVTYHLRWAREWVIRLGDGTEESHVRMMKALEGTWMYTGELFMRPAYAPEWLAYDEIQERWQQEVNSTLQEATLPLPKTTGIQHGGLQGRHTEYLGYILAEMQYMQRTYPNSTW
jgi:ring-1,2-phenylacetyl-CoA epoxidase subunit PaaC